MIKFYSFPYDIFLSNIYGLPGQEKREGLKALLPRSKYLPNSTPPPPCSGEDMDMKITGFLYSPPNQGRP
jgi:hypothetical protein